MASYERNRDLILLGAYKRGSDARVDEAIDRWPRIETFLRQGTHEKAGFEQTLGRLAAAGGDS